MNYKLCLLYFLIIYCVIVICFFLSLYFFIKHSDIKTIHMINKLFDSCNQPAVFNPSDFEWTHDFRANWKIILEEFRNYQLQYNIPYHNEINSEISSCDKNTAWKTLYLRAFNRDTKVAQFFPKTMKLINNSPCTLAYFSILKPRAKLDRHIGIYKGVIRYHLGLIIPNDWKNCWIEVNGEKLHWLPGKDLLFDDMFMHSVENNTDEERVILFLDIKRDFNNIILNAINSILLQFIKSNDILNETIDNVNKKSFKGSANAV